MPVQAPRNITYDDTRGVLIADYPEYIVNLVAPPQLTVPTIIFGYEDGFHLMLVHFTTLTDVELEDEESWRCGYDLRVHVYARRISDIIAAARRRWPEARIFRVPGCLCCNGIENLLDYDCEC